MNPRLGINIGPMERQVTVRSVHSVAWFACAIVGPVVLKPGVTDLLRAQIVRRSRVEGRASTEDRLPHLSAFGGSDRLSATSFDGIHHIINLHRS